MRPILQQLLQEVLQCYEANLREDAAAHEVETMRGAELEIEEFKQAVGQGMMTLYTEVRSEQAVVAMKRCTCEKPLTVHAWTQWKHGTLHGEVAVNDPYGYCPDCRQSQRPLHGLLGTERQRWSLAVQRAAVDFGVDHGFGKSEQKMAEHYRPTPIGKSSIRALVLRHGRQAFAHIEAKLQAAAAAGLERPWLRPGVATLEVQYDASFVRTGLLQGLDGEAVTAVRGLPKRRRLTEWRQTNLSVVQRPSETTRRYAARFGESDTAFDDLFGLACLAGWSLPTATTGIADGARHIRPAMEARFRVQRPAAVQLPGPSESKFQFILDRPHAKQHLMAAGEILAADEQTTPVAWMEAAIARIDRGEVGAVIAHLEREALRRENKGLHDEVEYFRRNQDAVDYERFRTEERSIASGQVESGHRHVIQERLKLPGTWWHPENVDPMLALRILRVNHWWEEYWQTQEQAQQRHAEQLRKRHLLAAA